MDKYRRVTSRQAVWIIIVTAVLWIPMTVFIVFFSAQYSPRHVAVLGLINMAVCVPMLIILYRKRISKMR